MTATAVFGLLLTELRSALAPFFAASAPLLAASAPAF
jgi:hypothetical protein